MVSSGSGSAGTTGESASSVGPFGASAVVVVGASVEDVVDEEEVLEVAVVSDEPSSDEQAAREHEPGDQDSCADSF